MDGKKRVSRTWVRIVTDLIKDIDGVRTLVIWDVDYKGKRILAETEIAFFAQDDDRNVWYLGEYPEEYEGGKLAKVPAWLHGRGGASAGIIMPAKPQLGVASYSQGTAPTAKFSDRARVEQMGATTETRSGRYTDVLVIAESNKEEKQAEQLKYYARGVGNVRIGWRGKGEKLQETLELVEVVKLSNDARASAMAAAIDLDKRAYQNASKIYAGTPPAEPLGGLIVRAHDKD